MGLRVTDSIAGVDWDQAKADLLADDFDNGRSAGALRQSFESSQHVAMAWDSDRVVGMARLLSDGVCNAYLVDVWTMSTYRRRGIGSSMVRLLAGRVPGQHIGLQTDDAEAFYLSLGFRHQPSFMSLVVGTWLDNDANRASDLAARVELPSSTDHGIPQTLADHGMVEQEAGSSRYMLGPAVLRLSSVYLDRLDFRSRALKWAEKLARRSGAAVRASGVATEHDEALLGESGLAAPVFEATGSVAGSIGIVIPSSEWPPPASLTDDVREAARNISRELGADSWPVYPIDAQPAAGA